MKLRCTALLLAFSAVLAAGVPFGKEIKQGSVTATLSTVTSNVPGVPSVPGAPAGGFMVTMKTERQDTTAYTVTARVKLANGQVTTVSQLVQRVNSWSPYTWAVFLVGPFTEVVTAWVDEHPTSASSEFISE